MGKYRGAAMLLLALVVFAATYHMFSGMPRDVLTQPSARNSTEALMARFAVGRTNEMALTQAGETLKRVRHVSQNMADIGDVIALPPDATIVQKQRPVLVRRKYGRRMRTHRVSMVYVSNDDGNEERYAVVDGRFCVEGTHLHAGAMVLRIRPESVLIGKDRMKRWFSVSGKVHKGNSRLHLADKRADVR